MSEYLLGLDVGTSSIRCVLTDASLRPLSVSRAPMSYHNPPGSSSITWEFDANALIVQAVTLVGQSLRQHGASPGQVAGLGIASQRQAVVLLDSDRNALLCSPNFDMRGIFQGAAIDDQSADAVYALTGHFPAFLLATSRIQWLRDARPDLYDQLHTVLPLASWLACELTGARVSEPAIDAEAGLLDVPSRSRSARLEQALNLESSWLPPLCPAGSHARRTYATDSRYLRTGRWNPGNDCRAGYPMRPVGIGSHEVGTTGSDPWLERRPATSHFQALLRP